MGKQHYSTEEVAPSQKQYYAKYLSEGEELVLVTGYSRIYLRQKGMVYMVLPGAVFWALGAGVAHLQGFNIGYGLLIGLLVSLIFAVIKVWFLNRAHKYLLTTRRVIVKGGFFSVNIASALYDKITHIEVDQGLVDRYLMHQGRLIIHTAGMKEAMVLDYVAYPIEFKNILERLINREREQFGRKEEGLIEN